MVQSEKPSAPQPPSRTSGTGELGLQPAGDATPFLRVEDLHKSIGDQEILRGTTVDIRRSETLVLIGRSGEGKSVFLKHLLGLMKPDRGRILFDGKDLCCLRERALGPIRRKIGILFQNGALFDSLTVAGNVAFPLRESGETNHKVIDEKVHHALDLVELAGHKEKMPINLSGGMRKRVALARAIISEPECILYDEPTAGLDPVVSDQINHLIRRLQHNLSVTSVVVTHDMKSAYHIADRIAYLREGQVYFLGSVEEIQNSDDELIQDFIEGRARHDDGTLLSDEPHRV